LEFDDGAPTDANGESVVGPPRLRARRGRVSGGLPWCVVDCDAPRVPVARGV